MSETDIVRSILAALNALPGVVAWRNNRGRAGKGRRVVFGLAPGASDIIGMVNGRFLALEVKKSHADKPTDVQRAFIVKVNEIGGIGAVVYSVDDTLRAIGAGERAA